MTACKNCGTTLRESDNFCPNCGGKVVKNRLTIINLFEHFLEQFFNYDNKFLRTLIDLVRKPEVVIGGYVSGVRKRYMNPIGFFAVALTLTGISIFITQKLFPEAMDFSTFDFGPSNKKSEDLDVGKATVNMMSDYSSIMVMMNIPLYALTSRLVFLRNKKYNYIEHIIFFLYTVAEISIVFFLPQLISYTLGTTMGEGAVYSIPIQILYTAYCLKRWYNLSSWGITLKTLLFFGVSILIMSIPFVIGVLLALVFKVGQ